MKLSTLGQFGVVLFLTTSAVAANPAKTSNPTAIVDGSPAASGIVDILTESQENVIKSSFSIAEKKLVLHGKELFGFDSEFLGENSEQALANLVSNLERMEKLVSIEVIGHTDSTGTKKANLRISAQRAKSVQAFLQGAYPEIHVSAKGLGETYPLHSNATKKGRELNRRVEILVSVETAVN